MLKSWGWVVAGGLCQSQSLSGLIGLGTGFDWVEIGSCGIRQGLDNSVLSDVLFFKLLKDYTFQLGVC